MKFTLTNDIAIHVTDLKKSVDFYRDILGLELIEANEEYARFRNGEANIYLNKSDRVISPILSFSVDDINEAKAYLTNSGFIVISDSGKSIYAKDINGIVFDFIQTE
ncbi:MAG: VOC family protein [Ignavibacteria bacterium]|nr:VOC family protein [Ignavibacteria bacterium]